MVKDKLFLFYFVVSVIGISTLLVLPMDNFHYELRLFSFQNAWLDEVIHILMFAYIFVMTYCSLNVKFRCIVFASLAFAALSEFMQGVLSASRSASLTDVYADIVGLIVGMIIVLFIKIIIEKSVTSSALKYNGKMLIANITKQKSKSV